MLTDSVLVDLNHLILIKLVVIKFAVLCALQRKEFKVTKKTSIITIDVTTPVLFYSNCAIDPKRIGLFTIYPCSICFRRG